MSTRQPRRRWLMLFGGAWLMQALSNGYYLLFFPVLAGLWIAVVRAVARRRSGRWQPSGHVGDRLASSRSAALGLPADSRRLQLSARSRRGQRFRRRRLVAARRVALAQILDAPVVSSAGRRAVSRASRRRFSSCCCVIQWLWTIGARYAGAARVPCAAGGRGRLRRRCAERDAFGAWAITIGQTTLVSVRVASKPLSIGVMLFVAALALEPRFAGRVAAALRR